MNQIIKFHLLTALFSLTLFSNVLNAQLFERTLGSLVNNDDVQDSKPLPNGRYILLSNTRSYGLIGKILLTRLNTFGEVEMNATLHDPANPSVAYSGTAIELDLGISAQHIGYFITGYRTTPYGDQIILIRTNLTGVVTWVKILAPASGSTERGVSVERQSNGDVTVVGTSWNPSTGVNQFVASRFNGAGGQIWGNRYSSGATFPGNGYEAREACNGMRSGVPVIAVTGTSNNHTFLSCINAGTGIEIWRRTYNSGYTNDEGADVVYKPANGSAEPARFMAVGSAGVSHPIMWAVRIDPVSGVANSKTYTPTVFYSSFTANSVTLDVDGTRAAITGSIVAQPTTGSFINNTFVMVLPFFGTELPEWTYYYESAAGWNNFAAKSISRIANEGYLVTCHANLTSSNNNDLHAIRINSTGSNGSVCARTALPVSRTPVGTSSSMTFTRTAATWTNITLTRTTRSYVQEACISNGLSDAGEDRSDILENNPELQADVEIDEPQLSPNPSNGQQAVRVTLELPEAGNIQVHVFNLVGGRIFSMCENLSEGHQELELPANQWPNGTYLVHIQSPRLQKTLKLVVSN